jgi:hypothetical protein
MPLAECGECGREVSWRARTCPGCGFEFAPASEPVPKAKEAPTVIEQTGKPYKVMQLVGVIILGIGVNEWWRGSSWAETFVGMGIVMAVSGRVLAWWHHA